MKLTSYKAIDDIYFVDTYNVTKHKLNNYSIDEGEQNFLGTISKTIYINDLDVLITFNNQEDNISFFEFFSGKIIHLERDLFELGYDNILDIYKNQDEEIQIKEDGFVSPKYGLGVYRKIKNGKYKNEIETIITYSDTYESGDDPDVDDIINFYLNDPNES